MYGFRLPRVKDLTWTRLTAENARLSEKLEASRALFSTVIQTAKSWKPQIARQQEANIGADGRLAADAGCAR